MTGEPPAETHTAPPPRHLRVARATLRVLLAFWLGCSTMLAISAATTFRETRAHQPVLQAEPWSDPAFADLQWRILAGNIVQPQFHVLSAIGGVCLAGSVIAGAWLLVAGRKWLSKLAAAGLIAILLAIAALYFVQAGWLEPALQALRSTMYDLAASPHERATARDAFDHLHGWSTRLIGLNMLLLIAGCVLPVLKTCRPRAANPWNEIASDGKTR